MPALSQDEKDGIDAVLDFLEEILTCLDQVPESSFRPDDKQTEHLRQAISDLRDLNASGAIDWRPNSDVNAGAETDGDGIHLNPRHRKFYPYALPPAMDPDDCETFDHHSLWKLIEILLHEWYHYAYHTGAWGLVVNKGLGNLLHLGGYVAGHAMGGLSEAVTGQGYPSIRNAAGHEYRAYQFTHWMLSDISHWLFWICQEDPDCLPCCGQQERHCRDAAERQDAWEWR